MKKIRIDHSTGCWLWTGAIGSHKRYGIFRLNGKTWLSHRAAWFLFKGEDPGKRCVCHHCDNGFCVNPSHLFIGTQEDNVHDMETKGRARHPKLEEHGRAKLTIKDVSEIRHLYAQGFTKRAIARMYPQVNRNTVRSVIDGKTWVLPSHFGRPK